MEIQKYNCRDVEMFETECTCSKLWFALSHSWKACVMKLMTTAKMKRRWVALSSKLGRKYCEYHKTKKKAGLITPATAKRAMSAKTTGPLSATQMAKRILEPFSIFYISTMGW